MQAQNIPNVAVIADAHLHDIYSDYDGASIGINQRNLTLRTWKDTRRSSRVFNESRPALIEALESIRKSGITIVVLLGDYSDDGQKESINKVVDVLRHYHKTHGLSFYSIAGNHDYYGPHGKHQSTRFARSPEHSVLVTSDPDIAATEPDTAILTRKMYCQGALDSLQPMTNFGLYRRESDHHWETPFGQEDSLEKRQYLATSEDGKNRYWLTDSSYLVEPTPGLWLLMLDTNVFEPRNGQWKVHQKNAFFNSSDAGWNSVLSNKSHLIDWIKDVAVRAKASGKCLLAFSHYPSIDPFRDTHNIHEKLFGQTSVSRRQPETAVAEQLIEAGLKIHFGGHMHVNGTNSYVSENAMLTDIAVPSLAAFPACYKSVAPRLNGCSIQTVSVGTTKLDADIMDFYRQECIARQGSVEPALFANNYGDFLYQRLHSRVENYYLTKDWPTYLAVEIKQATVYDVFYLLEAQRSNSNPLTLEKVRLSKDESVKASLATLAAHHGFELENFLNCSALTLIADWYCLRDAREQALSFLAPEQIRLYQFLSVRFGDCQLARANQASEFFTLFFGLMQIPLSCISQHDSDAQIIDFL